MPGVDGKFAHAVNMQKLLWWYEFLLQKWNMFCSATEIRYQIADTCFRNWPCFSYTSF